MNKIINDSFLNNDFPDESFDLCITDPPYKLSSGGCKGKSDEWKSKYSSGRVFDFNDISPDDYMPEIFRLLKNKTHFYCFSNDRNLKKMIESGEKAGFKLVNILVWQKDTESPTQYYRKNIEFVILFRKGPAKYINHIPTRALQTFPAVRGKNKTHPSEKPCDLLDVYVRNSSDEHQLVLEPFSGSGSLAEACIRANRNYVAFELDPEFYEKSLKRINELEQ